jgi:hypothetical protein
MNPHDTAADKSIGSFTNAGSKTFLRRLRNKLRRLTSGSEPDVVDADRDEPPLRADGGLKRPPTQGWIREDEAGPYVVCASVDARMRSCGGRMRLDEADSNETRWVWVCPDCDERLIQAREGRR